MDRFWFLTWTTYGTWLPGDVRGFVSPVWDETSRQLVVHNELGTNFDHDNVRLRSASKRRLKGSLVLLTIAQAETIAAQFHETARHRQWRLFAFAIMRNHVHVALAVPGDPEPDHILRDLKAYSSRSLNTIHARPASGTWWTESGSKRKILATEEDVARVVKYIEEQEFPLVVWTWAGREDATQADREADASRSPNAKGTAT